MDTQKARDILIAALVKSFVRDAHDDGAFLPDVAERGHTGFRHRLDLELAQEIVDLGLEKDDPAVDEALRYLEARHNPQP